MTGGATEGWQWWGVLEETYFMPNTQDDWFCALCKITGFAHTMQDELFHAYYFDFVGFTSSCMELLCLAYYVLKIFKILSEKLALNK